MKLTVLVLLLFLGVAHCDLLADALAIGEGSCGPWRLATVALGFTSASLCLVVLCALGVVCVVMVFCVLCGCVIPCMRRGKQPQEVEYEMEEFPRREVDEARSRDHGDFNPPI